MGRDLLNKITKLEKHTFKGKQVWCVETDAKDHWQPYKILTESGRIIERLPVMTDSEYMEWRKTIEHNPILRFIEGTTLDHLCPKDNELS